ncbi:MAG TPA: SCO family protein [Candidatus Limnocylindrales bacterium]|nr:SCO family protein [Candidatus Limnocylindrales bacterium]
MTRTATHSALTRHGYAPLAFALLGIVVTALGLFRAVSTPPGRSAGSPEPSLATDVAAFLERSPKPAPSIELTDSSGSRRTLAALEGHDVLVFFGYTHCPDVCPATIGVVGEAIRAAGTDVRALFVTVDPERDTVAWLAEYSAYLPRGFTALTGSAAEIATTAAAWGVRYARVEGSDPGAYMMSHTANVYLVDRTGTLRATFPFGTDSPAMIATIAAVDRSSRPAGPTSPTKAPAASSTTALTLTAEVVSTSVWAGPATPVILRLAIGGRPLDDPSAPVTVAVVALEGSPAGQVATPVAARAVRPPGVASVSWVASVVFPGPGVWGLSVTASPGSVPISTSVRVTALDPGLTAALGSAAPTSHTPTVADAGGDIRAVSTDPAPDPRLSTTSTTDALAAHQPFVLVADSVRFRVTSACGKAVVLARYLVDRWRDVAFIHLEPYRYSVVTSTAVLDGSLADPSLTEAAAAWGIGGPPWGALSMPWIFVVDGDGIVRAKAQGVVGSDDVDVILAMLEADAVP